MVDPSNDDDDLFSQQPDNEIPLFKDNQDPAQAVINENILKIKQQIIKDDELIRGIKEKELNNTLLKEENMKLKDDFISYKMEFKSKKDEQQYNLLLEELKLLQNKCIKLTEANTQFESMIQEKNNKFVEGDQHKKANLQLKLNIKNYEECVKRQKQLIEELENSNDLIKRERDDLLQKYNELTEAYNLVVKERMESKELNIEKQKCIDDLRTKLFMLSNGQSINSTAISVIPNDKLTAKYLRAKKKKMVYFNLLQIMSTSTLTGKPPDFKIKPIEIHEEMVNHFPTKCDESKPKSPVYRSKISLSSTEIKVPPIIKEPVKMPEAENIVESPIKPEPNEEKNNFDDKDVLDVDEAFQKFSEIQEVNRLKKADEALRTKKAKPKKKAQESKYKRPIPIEENSTSPFFNEVVISFQLSINADTIELVEGIHTFDHFLTLFLDVLKKKVVYPNAKQVSTYLNGIALLYMKQGDPHKVLSDLSSMILIPECLTNIVLKNTKKKKTESKDPDLFNTNLNLCSIFLYCYISNMDQSLSHKSNALHFIYQVIVAHSKCEEGIADVCLILLKHSNDLLKRAPVKERLMKFSEYRIGTHTCEVVKTAICIVSIICVKEKKPSMLPGIVELITSLEYEINSNIITDELEGTITTMLLHAPYPVHIKKIEDQSIMQYHDTFIDICHAICLLFGFIKEEKVELILLNSLEKAQGERQTWLTYLYVIYSILPIRMSTKPKLMKAINGKLFPKLEECSDSFEKVLLISVMFYMTIDKMEMNKLRRCYSTFSPDMKECTSDKVHAELSLDPEPSQVEIKDA